MKRLKIPIIRPDINKSNANFYSDGKNFFYALGAIKNVGFEAISNIIKDREKNGKFKSLIDLLKRVNNSALNKKIIEALIFSNSLISLEKNQYFY